ncbi:hypothetical protein [Paludisphaera borealis]|uniref:Uncharacterized protein n=1 Tax=Paludisphaera borealis TaxID=1387353 RepID=A0A1U7CXL4_9BACT|nr:hypothetical protein [Paludisphaera borealis]APW63692.1 hypothetical protein BSF38_05266 [Paludisphaera borealis]
MRHRPIVKFHPDLELLEKKQLMSVRGLAPPSAALRPGARAAALRQARAEAAAGNVVDASGNPADQTQAAAADPTTADPNQTSSQSPRFLVSRITNPTPINHVLTPPFAQVAVQNIPPIPGQTYNVYAVSMRNSTRLTFDVDSGFNVKFSGQTKEHSYPILTGDQKWLPNQVMVFYVLTKSYYPARPMVSGGFEFDLAGSRGIAIGGPSAIFLRIKYDPAKFPGMLDWITVHGPGAYGHRTGIADTSIWQFTRVP